LPSPIPRMVCSPPRYWPEVPALDGFNYMNF